MAGNTAILAVKIIGDASGATRALAQVDRAVANTADATGKSGKKMGGVWTAVAAAMAGCAKAASDLEQATGAVNQIFGDMGPEMMEFAAGMQQYGLSTAQAAQASAILGAQLKNAGIPMEQTAVITQELIMLATDMAAVFGGTVPQAVGALGAALRGEFDTLERYGVTLTADSVAAEAARLSAEGLTFASEQQAKMVATLSLIWQQTADIQGAAAEETDTLAASMGALRAAVTNLAAALGGFLLPILVPIIQAITNLITLVTNLITESELLTQVTEILAGVLEALEPVLTLIADALKVVADALETVIGWVNDAIDAFQRFIDTLQDAWDALTFWNNEATVEAPEQAAAASARARGVGFGVNPLAGMTAPSRTVIVQGLVLDADGIARQLRRIDRDSRRRGWVPARAGV